MPKSKQGAKSCTTSDLLVNESSGNVFVDLGFSKCEAANLVLRCELMDAIEAIIQERRWTPEETARKLGARRQSISDLLQGHIDVFTVDTLIEWLDKLGKEVHLTLKDKEVA